MQRVTAANPDHPGYQHCLTLRDAFISYSYHGPHMSLATDVLGSDTLTLRRVQPRRVFSVHVTKRIIKQTLLALDYLHRECGLVHTGTSNARAQIFTHDITSRFPLQT